MKLYLFRAENFIANPIFIESYFPGLYVEQPYWISPDLFCVC